MSDITQSNSHQHHDHGYQHDSVTHANKLFFDNPEFIYENHPHVRDRAVRVAKAIVNAHKLDKETTTAMDFACGNGLVSEQLIPHVKSILGVDISQRMVEQYNEKLKDKEASAVCAELQGEENELNGARFDMIFCASAYHHFASVNGITRILTSFLTPGGVLIVTDMVYREEGYTFENSVKEAVPHKHGLSRREMQEAFDGAGLSMKSFESISSADHKDDDLFLAIGQKLPA